MNELTHTVLLIIHIIAGFTALISAFVAASSKIFGWPHRLHAISGQFFYYGMLIIFLTTVPLTIINPNVFLFLIAVFSFYLAYSGMRLAKNRSGKSTLADTIKNLIMFITSLIMIASGVYNYFDGGQSFIVLFIFGSIGLLASIQDYLMYSRGTVKGKDRLRAHSGMMMGASIATITAFLVTNFSIYPPWLLWILPTLVISPLVPLINRKVLNRSKF